MCLFSEPTATTPGLSCVSPGYLCGPPQVFPTPDLPQFFMQEVPPTTLHSKALASLWTTEALGVHCQVHCLLVHHVAQV